MARQARAAARHADITRTSPAAARSMTVARKKDITPIVRNGTPPGDTPGLLKAFTPPTMEPSASPTTTVSAAALRRRVHGQCGRLEGWR